MTRAGRRSPFGRLDRKPHGKAVALAGTVALIALVFAFWGVRFTYGSQANFTLAIGLSNTSADLNSTDPVEVTLVLTNVGGSTSRIVPFNCFESIGVLDPKGAVVFPWGVAGAPVYPDGVLVEVSPGQSLHCHASLAPFALRDRGPGDYTVYGAYSSGDGYGSGIHLLPRWHGAVQSENVTLRVT